MECKYGTLESLHVLQLWYAGMICSYVFIDIFLYLLWVSRRYARMQAVTAEYLHIHNFTCHVVTCLPICVLCQTKLLDSKPKYAD